MPLPVQLAIGIFDMVVKHSFSTAHASMQSVPPALRHTRSHCGKVEHPEQRCLAVSVRPHATVPTGLDAVASVAQATALQGVRPQSDGE